MLTTTKRQKHTAQKKPIFFTKLHNDILRLILDTWVAHDRYDLQAFAQVSSQTKRILHECSKTYVNFVLPFAQMETKYLHCCEAYPSSKIHITLPSIVLPANFHPNEVRFDFCYDDDDDDSTRDSYAEFSLENFFRAHPKVQKLHLSRFVKVPLTFAIPASITEMVWATCEEDWDSRPNQAKSKLESWFENPLTLKSFSLDCFHPTTQATFFDFDCFSNLESLELYTTQAFLESRITFPQSLRSLKVKVLGKNKCFALFNPKHPRGAVLPMNLESLTIVCSHHVCVDDDNDVTAFVLAFKKTLKSLTLVCEDLTSFEFVGFLERLIDFDLQLKFHNKNQNRAKLILNSNTLETLHVRNCNFTLALPALTCLDIARCEVGIIPGDSHNPIFIQKIKCGKDCEFLYVEKLASPDSFIHKESKDNLFPKIQCEELLGSTVSFEYFPYALSATDPLPSKLRITTRDLRWTTWSLENLQHLTLVIGNGATAVDTERDVVAALMRILNAINVLSLTFQHTTNFFSVAEWITILECALKSFPKLQSIKMLNNWTRTIRSEGLSQFLALAGFERRWYKEEETLHFLRVTNE